MPSCIRILALDGGGSKGIFAIGVLSEIEKKLGKPILDKFDLFFGCSTGAIIASALAAGKDIRHIRKLYDKNIPHVMNTIFRAERTRRLKILLEQELGSLPLSNIKKPLAIVTTSVPDKRVKIFKTSEEFAHGRNASFVPLFGATLAEAVLASCSAYPFFEQVQISTPNGNKFSLIDGGFSCSNPSLFAAMDGLRKLDPGVCVKILNIGTGSFSEGFNLRAVISGIRHASSAPLLTTMMDVSANTIAWVTERMSHNVELLRINKHAPDFSTHILETDSAKLNQLYQYGADCYGEHEKQIEEFFRD